MAVTQILLGLLLTSTANQIKWSDYSFIPAEEQWVFFSVMPETCLKAVILPNWGNLELKPRQDISLYSHRDPRNTTQNNKVVTGHS